MRLAWNAGKPTVSVIIALTKYYRTSDKQRLRIQSAFEAGDEPLAAGQATGRGGGVVNTRSARVQRSIILLQVDRGVAGGAWLFHWGVVLSVSVMAALVISLMAAVN